MSDPPAPLSRRLVAEGLGTAILVATVVGSGIMAERLAGGNQAIALLGNTIPTGAILIVIITILGPISGAHFNPAVTLVFAIRGMTPWREVIPYVLVQCLCGIAGTVLAHLMFDLAPLVIGTTARSGPSQWLAEAVATFTLILTILGGLRYAPQSIPMAGWSGHHRRLLVHVIDLVCEPGRHARPRFHDDVCRNRDQPRAGVCRGTDHRRPRRGRGNGAVSVGSMPVKNELQRRRVIAPGE